MCETLAKSDRTAESESGFTVGLFSVLDVLAGRPMEEILAELPLSEDVKAALLNREGSLGTTLQTVLDYETRLETAANPGDQATDPARMMQIYLDAVASSDAIFAELTV